MFILEMFQDVLAKAGVIGVLILAGYLAIGVGAVLWLGLSILRAAWRAVRWRLVRRQLQVLRGHKPAPLFRLYPELDDATPPRPPRRSLRPRRGDNDDAAA